MLFLKKRPGAEYLEYKKIAPMIMAGLEKLLTKE
jgi:hypothetical protein